MGRKTHVYIHTDPHDKIKNCIWLRAKWVIHIRSGRGIWLWILLFNGIVKKGFINALESGLGLQKMRFRWEEGQRKGILGDKISRAWMWRQKWIGHFVGPIWVLPGEMECFLLGVLTSDLSKYGGARFAEDSEYQFRDFRLYLLENGESLSFRKGDVVIKSCFKKICLLQTYRVSQWTEEKADPRHTHRNRVLFVVIG